MNNSVILALIALAVLAVVAYPLVRRGRLARSAAPTRRAPPSADVPDESPAAIALREIALDRDMGRLSEADYEALRERYERELHASTPGVRAIPPSDARPRDSGGAEAVRPGLDARAEALVARYRGHGVACPTCGARPEPDATFCSSCGRRLAPCATCGAAITEPDARFCPTCGASLSA